MSIIKSLKNHLPVSRKTHIADLAQMLEIINGLLEADEQHSQLEMTFIQEIQTLKLKNNILTTSKKPSMKNDPAFN